jgi:hypothetical protein
MRPRLSGANFSRAAAVELIPGANTANILGVKNGGDVESLQHHEASLSSNVLSTTAEEGPCRQAALQDTIVGNDFRRETRWAQYFPAMWRSAHFSSFNR